MPLVLSLIERSLWRVPTKSEGQQPGNELVGLPLNLYKGKNLQTPPEMPSPIMAPPIIRLKYLEEPLVQDISKDSPKKSLPTTPGKNLIVENLPVLQGNLHYNTLSNIPTPKRNTITPEASLQFDYNHSSF